MDKVHGKISELQNVVQAKRAEAVVCGGGFLVDLFLVRKKDEEQTGGVSNETKDFEMLEKL